MFVRVLVLLLFSVGVALAAVGMDISAGICEEGVSQEIWNCLAQQGLSFASIQVWEGGYEVNQNIGGCVGGAWAAGFSHVDVYAFLCPNCYGNNPPNYALSEIRNTLTSEGVNFGMLW
eukprot:TRINITY_DN16063_c0_g1_i1.p1 TRINITY_DN16063_c0_g1~~TRINITY_DN16063_c0_g1_i1.p1  ORF type:complete len:118 (+),score=15.20 TRINITY_DN16063_c0_g1_i1:35-388(+)